MILKIISCVAIIVICGLAGKSAGYNKRRRAVSLAGLLQAMDILRTEIELGQAPLNQALARCGGADVSGITAKAAKKLEQGEDLNQAWHETLEQAHVLDKKAKDILLSFGGGLSSYDVNSQVRNIETTKARLVPLVLEAEQKACLAEEVYFKISLLCGMAISVMML